MQGLGAQGASHWEPRESPELLDIQLTVGSFS